MTIDWPLVMKYTTALPVKLTTCNRCVRLVLVNNPT